MSRDGSYPELFAVPAEDFVRLWQESPTAAEACRRIAAFAVANGLHVPRGNGIQSRAAHLRRRGVALKKFTRRPRILDVEALNRVAASAAE